MVAVVEFGIEVVGKRVLAVGKFYSRVGGRGFLYYIGIALLSGLKREGWGGEDFGAAAAAAAMRDKARVLIGIQ